MYPIPNHTDREWSEGDDKTFSDDHSPEVRDDHALEEIPEPPDFWTLQDFEDLLPIEVD
ncbi:MAG: hypothetical protein OES46_09845 [Gammaproteobacteria bacterium]|nr:hypothetical protein [Gammaproteobacteria bacterium]